MDLKVITIVTIENFPLKNEIFKILDKFLEDNKLDKQYNGYNKGNNIELQFLNPVHMNI